MRKMRMLEDVLRYGNNIGRSLNEQCKIKRRAGATTQYGLLALLSTHTFQSDHEYPSLEL